MSKQTRKFKVVAEENITFTHEIEVPVSFLDEKLKDCIDCKEEYEDRIDEVLHEYYEEFIDYPEMKTKTITDIDFGYDTQVNIEEVDDE